MEHVLDIAEGTGTASGSVLTAANEVGTTADTLRVEVRDFLAAMTRHDDDERRAYERIPGGGASASLSIRHGDTVVAVIEDISRGGVALKCDTPASPGTEVCGPRMACWPWHSARMPQA